MYEYIYIYVYLYIYIHVCIAIALAIIIAIAIAIAQDESLAHIYDSKDNTEQYQQWALHLQTLLHDVVPAEAVTRESVSDMLTPKNVVIPHQSNKQ